VAAQRRIDAAAKRKYSAAAQLLPTLRLSASAGRNGSIWDLTDPTTFQPTGERDWVWNDQWAVGGQLSVPLFNGGRTHSALQQANFGVHTAVQNYNTVLATAVLEVETAVASETQSTLSLTAAEAQADAARLAYESALDQYRDGTASFLTLFTAQNTYQSAELGLVDSQRNLISARLNLYDAIGGPWVSELPQPRRSTP
jgi:outer membrane protein TolC